MSDTDENAEGAREDKDEGEGEFDPEARRLCPDDSCIGVIGPDGKCKVCGKESPDGPPPAAATADKPAAKAEAEKKAPKPAPTGKGSASGFDADDRILCSDGCCTGLIGPDGKCKVCGKRYEG
jgi:hypothetical protein